MLILRGNLTPYDRKFLNKFCRFVMDHFVTPAIQKNATIIIKFENPDNITDEAEKATLKKWKAWTTYDGKSHGKRHFTIVTNDSIINKRSKKSIRRIKNAILCIGHELVHVKQYLNNECFDYVSGDVRFKGDIYTDWDKGDKGYEALTAYYLSPWEIEAYGHEEALYRLFEQKLKDEVKKD